MLRLVTSHPEHPPPSGEAGSRFARCGELQLSRGSNVYGRNGTCFSPLIELKSLSLVMMVSIPTRCMTAK